MKRRLRTILSAGGCIVLALAVAALAVAGVLYLIVISPAAGG